MNPPGAHLVPAPPGGPRVVVPASGARASLAFAGLILFIALVYTNPSNLFPVLGDRGYTKMAAAAALAALGGAWLLHDRRLTLGGGIGLCLAGLFAVMGGSIWWSYFPALSRAAFADGLKYFAIFVLVANVIDDARRARNLVHALAWASLAPATGAIVSYLRGEHLVEGDRAAWIGIFADPNYLAFHLAVGIAMTLAARELARSVRVRVLYLAVLGVIGVALTLTQSRGGLLAAGAVLLLWLVGGTRRWRAALGVIAVALVVAHAAPESTWRRAGTTLSYAEDASAQGRIDAWRTGLRIAAARPLSGIGAGAFMVAWPEYAPGDAGPPRTAHNTLIQLIAETGVPSLMLYLIALCAALYSLRCTARRIPELSIVARATAVGLCAFLVCGATLGLAYSWPPFFLLGLAAALQRMPAAAPPARAPARHSARFSGGPRCFT